MSQLEITHLLTLPVQNQLGEGVIWDEAANCILWTDIESAKLYQYYVETEELVQVSLPERLGSFGLTGTENELICAFASGFALFNIKTHKLNWIEKVETDNPGTRMNDGRVDRNGRFWAGSMVEDEAIATEKGALYSLGQELKSVRHLTNIQISNGLCWSPDGKIMYFADSPTHKIIAFDSTVQLSDTTPSKTLTETNEDHFPDGSTVDKFGNIWNALWGSGKLVCYSPEGEKLQEVSVPVSQPSCISIGGPNLDWLIVTSASQLSEQQKQQEPNAGNLFIYQLSQSIGLPESRFKR